MRHFQQVLQGAEVSSVSCLGQLTVATRPVENVTLTTKGLQERKHNIKWDDSGKIDNKNK